MRKGSLIELLRYFSEAKSGGIYSSPDRHCGLMNKHCGSYFDINPLTYIVYGPRRET